MRELRLRVPTYNYQLHPGEVDQGTMPEFGPSLSAVVAYRDMGIRVVLGSSDRADLRSPDVQIERQPHGWAVFIHPLGGSDPAACVYMRDDGQSFIVPAYPYGPTPELVILPPGSDVPGFDDARASDPE